MSEAPDAPPPAPPTRIGARVIVNGAGDEMPLVFTPRRIVVFERLLAWSTGRPPFTPIPAHTALATWGMNTFVQAVIAGIGADPRDRDDHEERQAQISAWMDVPGTEFVEVNHTVAEALVEAISGRPFEEIEAEQRVAAEQEIAAEIAEEATPRGPMAGRFDPPRAQPADEVFGVEDGWAEIVEDRLRALERRADRAHQLAADFAGALFESFASLPEVYDAQPQRLEDARTAAELLRELARMTFRPGSGPTGLEVDTVAEAMGSPPRLSRVDVNLDVDTTSFSDGARNARDALGAIDFRDYRATAEGFLAGMIALPEPADIDAMAETMHANEPVLHQTHEDSDGAREYVPFPCQACGGREVVSVLGQLYPCPACQPDTVAESARTIAARSGGFLQVDGVEIPVEGSDRAVRFGRIPEGEEDGVIEFPNQGPSHTVEEWAAIEASRETGEAVEFGSLASGSGGIVIPAADAGPLIEEAQRRGRPVLDPNAMHGAADGFGGTDEGSQYDRPPTDGDYDEDVARAEDEEAHTDNGICEKHSSTIPCERCADDEDDE